jgi:hypothetical protein
MKTFKLSGVLVCALLTGCVMPIYDQYQYPGYGQGYGVREQGVNEGANHLNMVVNPNLPAPVYRDCQVGQWNMTATTTQNGNQFSGHASQSCSPTPSRSGGVNIGTLPTRQYPQE